LGGARRLRLEILSAMCSNAAKTATAPTRVF